MLLREILKCTPEDNPDRKLIPQIMDLITEFLVQVNTEAGSSENAFNLQQIEGRLSFKVSDDFVVISFFFNYILMYTGYSDKLMFL